MTHHNEVPTADNQTEVAGRCTLLFTYRANEHRHDEGTIREYVAYNYAEVLLPDCDVTFNTIDDCVYAWMVPATEPSEYSTFFITSNAVFWRNDSTDSRWNVRFTKEQATMKDIPSSITSVNITNPEVFIAMDDIGDLPTLSNEDIIVSTEPSSGTGENILSTHTVVSLGGQHVIEELDKTTGGLHYDNSNKAPEMEPLVDVRDSVREGSPGNKLDNIFVGTLTTEQGVDLIVAAASRDADLAQYLKHRLNTVFSVL